MLRIPRRAARRTIACLCYLALLSLYSAASAAADRPSKRILILGDSISAEYGIPAGSGWVAMLAAKRPQDQIINASISGETSAGGLSRLPALLARHQPDLLLIELGGNDGLRGFPVPQLYDNLAQMLALARAAGTRSLLLGIKIPPNYGRRYSELFADSYQRLAEQAQVSLLPFILEGIAGNDALMQGDGIHPNQAAQEKILALVEPLIRQILDQG